MYIDVNQQMPVRIPRGKLARRFKAFNLIIISAGGSPPVSDTEWNLIASGALLLTPDLFDSLVIDYQTTLQTL